MPGIYTNDKNEIVACMKSPNKKNTKAKGLTWHNLPRKQWPDGDLVTKGFPNWKLIDGVVVAANVDEQAAANAQAEKAGRIKVVRVYDYLKSPSAVETYFEDLDSIEEQPGYPHDITWPELIF